MANAVKLIFVLALLLAGSAYAKPHDKGDKPHDKGDKAPQSEYGAPEPLTMIGLAVGGATAGIAAWRVRRKR